MAVRLEWEGKPTQVERLALPFQTVETINESRATRERDSGGLFAAEVDTIGARNQLIWGNNKLVMSSLLAEYAGQVRLVYIDPPFDTGADFSFRVSVGDGAVTKQPSVLEEHAYRDLGTGPAVVPGDDVRAARAASRAARRRRVAVPALRAERQSLPEARLRRDLRPGRVQERRRLPASMRAMRASLLSERPLRSRRRRMRTEPAPTSLRRR